VPDILPAAGPQRPRTKTWSELSKGEKAAFLAILAIPLFCCIGVVNIVDDDDDLGTPSDRASESASVATESPSPPAPTTTRPAPVETATTEAAVAETEETEAAPAVSYDNCSEAEDAGVTPINRGEPGYADHLDGDGDGVACESGSSDPDPEPESEEPEPEPEPEASSEEDEDVYYENCDAARAAGAAPVHAGEPGYGSHLDRDGDGVGCE
jgi:hypothetical protein